MKKMILYVEKYGSPGKKYTILVDVFGWVLQMPWRGCSMWPFAVAGLGLRYLRNNFFIIYGHPLRSPCGQLSGG
jgi:hypothetical protein